MHREFIPLPISRTTEYGFSFVEPVRLVDGLQHTPMWANAPRAPVVLSRDNRYLQWKVLRCPYCCDTHYHNIDPPSDPRQYLGGRCSHCLAAIPEDPHRLGEYRLIAIVGEPTEEGLDRHFPLWWPTSTQTHKRSPISRRIKAQIWRKSDGHCWYCGDELNPFTNFEVDHFLSLKNGGSNAYENLVPSCRQCNANKSHWHVEVFRIRHRPQSRFWFELNGKAGAS